MAVWILLGLVTRRSSPTIWILVSEVSFFVNGGLDSFRISNKKIIAYNLDISF